MSSAENLHEQALAYHQRFPRRLWNYLNERGIADSLIHKYLLGWNGQRITIPITNREGVVSLFKLAKDPADTTDSPKMLATCGSHAELYGWERVLAKPHQMIICEGEFDRLVLEARGFAAVTSTGGAMTFRSEWAEALREIPHVYICFDNDEAGRTGSERVARLIPHAQIVRLPDEVGASSDVTDFSVHLAKSREEFVRLLEVAQPLPEEKPSAVAVSPTTSGHTREDNDVALVKARVAVEELIARYVPLRRSGGRFIARCPFHDDRIPSFVVYPATRSFFCFGCQASGDALSFLMKVKHLTFPEALRALRESYR
jgi:DNA primase